MAEATDDRIDAAVQHAISRRDIKEIKDRLDGVDNRFDKLEMIMSNRYVTKEEFKPIRYLVYGFTGVILVTVIGAILTLVLTTSILM